MREKTEIYSIFGQIDAVIAQAMVDETRPTRSIRTCPTDRTL